MSTVGRTKREQSISAAVQLLHTQCIVISGTLKKIGQVDDKEVAAVWARQQVQELSDPSSAALQSVAGGS